MGDDVAVEVGVAAREAYRVLGGPPPYFGIVVAGTEAGELGVPVKEATGEAKQLRFKPYKRIDW